jgi:hypothetical protein
VRIVGTIEHAEGGIYRPNGPNSPSTPRRSARMCH